MTEKELQEAFSCNPLYKKMLEHLQKNQKRYPAEPVFSRTGKGELRSEGVNELEKIKRAVKDIQRSI